MVSEHSVTCRIETLGLDWKQEDPRIKKNLSHIVSVYKKKEFAF
jgi:hypothetical protein